MPDRLGNQFDARGYDGNFGLEQKDPSGADMSLEIPSFSQLAIQPKK